MNEKCAGDYVRYGVMLFALFSSTSVARVNQEPLTLFDANELDHTTAGVASK